MKGKICNMYKKIVLLSFVSVLLLSSIIKMQLILPVEAHPAMIKVPGDYLTIQAAINAANPGDAIYVYNGTYYEHLTITKDNLTITGENANITIIDGSGAGIVVDVTADNVKISGFTIQNGAYGIYLYQAGGTIIRDNTLCYNTYGITLDSSDSNIIIGNTIILNDNFGIDLYSSVGNSISDNVISNDDSGIGLHDGSGGNSIFSNTISDNGYVGVDVWLSGGNVIYHNNFIDNTQQVYSDGTNAWDNGAEGNYWSSYTGADANGDGIGETPHVIDANNIDRYPLVEPWSSFRIYSINVETTTYYVTTLSNSTLASFNFSQSLKQISFNVTGPTGTSGFCNVTIPEDLLWGEFSVYKDGSLLVKNADYTQTYNGSHYIFYITYTHTTHGIKIRSTEVIPEFPTWTSMLLILLVLTVAIAIYKRRLLKTLTH